MKIIAIWERPQSHERYGVVFCLLEDERLLTCGNDREYQGTDKDGERVYKETGLPDWGDAFDASYRFDLRKADYFMRHFGGQLVWKS